MSRFSNLIFAYRKRAGKSQNEVASLLGVTAGYVSLVEKGKSLPYLESHCKKLIEFFGLSKIETEEFLYWALHDRAPDEVPFLYIMLHL